MAIIVSIGNVLPVSAIIDGSDATSAPSGVAALQLWNGYAWGMTCGAALIDRDTLITAAHCVTEKAKPGERPKVLDDPRHYVWQVRLGSLTHAKGGVTARVNKIEVHPAYRGTMTRIVRDIAVLHLKETLPPKSPTQPIGSIQMAKSVSKSKNTLLFGWGALRRPIIGYAATLQKTTGKVVDNRHCQISRSELCLQAAPDTMICEGDSGTPALQKNSQGTWTVVALTSRTLAGCYSRYATYTDVVYHREWITCMAKRDHGYCAAN